MLDHYQEVDEAAQQLEGRVRRSNHAWRSLGLRMRTITPRRLGRMLMVVGALAGLGWLVASNWAELVPFQLGLVLAYITLPIVNALDRIMPRALAASLLVLFEIVGLVLLLGLLIPPIAQELAVLLPALPDFSDLQDRVVEVRARLNALPEPTQGFVRQGMDQVLVNLRSNLSAYVQGAAAVTLASILGLFNTLGFVLGLFGIPTWLVAVLSDQKVGVRLVNRVLPDWLRPDFWAVLRIADRTFGAFVRGQLVLAVLVGLLTYVGLTLLNRFGGAQVPYQLLLALIAGLFQLIPAIGPVLSLLMALALGLTASPQTALAIVGLYVAVQLVQARLVAPHLEKGYLGIHPAVFVILLVLLSQFGFLWVLIAAPLSTVLRDLFQYVYGRLGEPPRRAGLLPGQVDPISIRAVRRTAVHG